MTDGTAGQRAPLWLSLLGVIVRVDVEDDELAEQVHWVTTDLHGDPCADDGAVRVTVTGRGPWLVNSRGHSSQVAELHQALTAVLAAVNLSGVAATRALACHAAVLSRDGKSLVVPARSGRGKTTLTAALVQRGWDYVSDEALCLTWESGRILGYPRPLALSHWTRSELAISDGLPGSGEWHVPGSLLGARPLATAPPVTDLVLLHRVTGVGVTLEECPRQEALAELVRRQFTAHTRPERALGLLTSLVRDAHTWRLGLGPPGRAADLLTAMVSDAS